MDGTVGFAVGQAPHTPTALSLGTGREAVLGRRGWIGCPRTKGALSLRLCGPLPSWVDRRLRRSEGALGGEPGPSAVPWSRGSAQRVHRKGGEHAGGP